MMFQLSLSEALQTQLKATAQAGPESDRQPVVFGAAHARMASLPGYVKSAAVSLHRLCPECVLRMCILGPSVGG